MQCLHVIVTSRKMFAIKQRMLTLMRMLIKFGQGETFRQLLFRVGFAL